MFFDEDAQPIAGDAGADAADTSGEETKVPEDTGEVMPPAEGEEQSNI